MSLESNKMHAILRSDLYSWFTAALYVPEADILTREFAASGVDLFVDLWGEGFQKEYKAMLSDLQTVSLTDLKREYTRLFLGPAVILVYAYESYYRDSGRVMGDSTMAVVQFYNQCGMAMEPTMKEVPDHIAIELNFLSQLAELESKAWDNNEAEARRLRERQAAFLEEHLLRWVDLYAAGIQEHAQASFYLRVSTLLQQFIAAERAWSAEFNSV